MESNKTKLIETEVCGCQGLGGGGYRDKGSKLKENFFFVIKADLQRANLYCTAK